MWIIPSSEVESNTQMFHIISDECKVLTSLPMLILYTITKERWFNHTFAQWHFSAIHLWTVSTTAQGLTALLFFSSLKWLWQKHSGWVAPSSAEHWSFIWSKKTRNVQQKTWDAPYHTNIQGSHAYFPIKFERFSDFSINSYQISVSVFQWCNE